MPSDRQPDIVVGIDFGMTCTAVAYSMGPDWAHPTTIQRWPHPYGQAAILRNKVATKVAYPRQGGKIKWGELVDIDQDYIEIGELFKLYLDPRFNDNNHFAPGVEQARRWFKDYLTELYGHIMRYFGDRFPNAVKRNIEFVFSTPTTWTDPAMINSIEEIISQAGFGSRPNYHINISLTEAEAAAAYAARQCLEKDDVVIVVDAGGGTTDVHIFKMLLERQQRRSGLQPLTIVEGRPIGSAFIDLKVEELLVRKLQSCRDALSGDLEHVAAYMMRDVFEPFKCAFGTDTAESTPALILRIPGVSPAFNNPFAGISNGRVEISRDELKEIFDEQVNGIFELIDTQLRYLQQGHPREQVAYLILSGGLGSSEYVRKRFVARYEQEAASIFPNAQNIQILKAEEPQLAVVMGIVLDRVQEIKSGFGAYKEICARNSYGIICREPYDPALHQGETITTDPHDKKRWAENQLQWLIKQGDLVSLTSGVERLYRLKLNMGQEEMPWSTRVFMSAYPRTQLQKSLREEGVRPLCAIEARLKPSDMTRKNKHWYNLQREYNQAEFKVKVVVRSANLKFEIHGKDGIRSTEHEEISVRWEDWQTPDQQRTVNKEAGTRRMFRNRIPAGLNNERQPEMPGWGSRTVISTT